MLTIQAVIDAARTIKKTDSFGDALKKVAPVATIYCREHPEADQLILVIQVLGRKPFLFAHFYDYSATNLHECVKVALNRAEKAMPADIIVLEWLFKSKTKLPYYGFMS